MAKHITRAKYEYHCEAMPASSRHIHKKSSFPGPAPGKDTLRAANAATKERFTGRQQNKRKRILLSSRLNLSLRQNKKSVFSRTCAGKRHLKSRERGDEREVHGEKTTERASCEVRLVSSRRFPKVGLTGRKRVKRSDYPLSSRPLTNLCYTAPRRR